MSDITDVYDSLSNDFISHWFLNGKLDLLNSEQKMQITQFSIKEDYDYFHNLISKKINIAFYDFIKENIGKSFGQEYNSYNIKGLPKEPFGKFNSEDKLNPKYS